MSPSPSCASQPRSAHSIAAISAEDSTIRGSRPRSRSSSRAARPMPRVPHQSCPTITQAATVVPSAAARKPATGISPTATAAFTTIEITA